MLNKYKYIQGIAMIESLLAMLILNLLIFLALESQSWAIHKEREEYQNLVMVNQLQNLVERFRVNREDFIWAHAFEDWRSQIYKIIPNVNGAYHCNAGHYCYFSIQSKNLKAYQLEAQL